MDKISVLKLGNYRLGDFDITDRGSTEWARWLIQWQLKRLILGNGSNREQLKRNAEFNQEMENCD